jgi:hypothetical protein
MLPPYTIVLAAEGGVVFVIVLIISVISWIVNLVQGNKPKAKPGNRQRQANQGQSELEKFLQEVVGNKPAPEPEKRRPAPAQKPARAAAAERKGGKSKPQSQRPPAAQRPAAADRPGARLAQTHLAPTAVGEGVRSHVSSHLEPRNVDAAVKRDVEGTVQRDIGDTVRQDIGVDGTLLTTQRAPVHPLIQALRSPQGVRQAVIMSEILNRPKSLR